MSHQGNLSHRGGPSDAMPLCSLGTSPFEPEGCLVRSVAAIGVETVVFIVLWDWDWFWDWDRLEGAWDWFWLRG